MDQGVLETDVIHGYKIWVPPFKSDVNSSGQTYHITLRVAERGSGRPPGHKRSLAEGHGSAGDFFSDPRAVPSDGLEEKALLYA